ncbi:MAG TPA: hypothetical protein PLN68_08800, partial [Elusimicrobiales bacterium]|nr:hypothetical protein [Elusimicrobiales bacterium]
IAGFFAIGTAIRKIYIETSEYIKVNRELNGILKIVGENNDNNKKKIEDYISALTKGTYFTKDETLRAFSELVKITGNVDSALKLLKISMDVSVGLGKSLSETIGTIRIAMMSGRDASVILGKEFGKLGMEGKTLDEILTNLGKNFNNARLNITGAEKSITELKTGINETAQTIGQLLLPIVNKFISAINESIKVFTGIIEAVSVRTAQLYLVLKSIITLNLKDIKEINKLASEEIQKIWDERSKKEIDNIIKIKNTTIQSRKETQQQEEEFKKAKEKAGEEINKIEEKIFENTLKYTSDAYNYKIEMLNKEYEETRQKIGKMFNDRLIDYNKYMEMEVKLTEYREQMITQIQKEQEEQRKKIKEEIRKLEIESIKSDMEKNLGNIYISYQNDLENYKEMLEQKKISLEEFNKLMELRNEKLNNDLLKNNEEFIKKWKEHSDTMKAISEHIYSSLFSVFNSFISEAIKGGKNLEDALKNIFNNILNAFINMLTQMAAEYLAKKFIFSVLGFNVGGGFFGVLGGGQSGYNEIPQTGTYLLHKGEKVLSPNGIGSETFNKENKQEIHLHINTFDIRQIDRMHIEKIARTLAPYLKRYT